ncbi:MAG: type III PLP-dependent enzyme [Planctomycetota bacterium]
MSAPRLFALDDATYAKLAEEHGTPLFVYDAATARAGYRRLRAALPERATIAFAVKSNPFQPLLELFAELGASFDCASIGELERVARLGLPGSRVYMTGPGKRMEELERAYAMGARVQCEGFEDLARLDRIATRELHVNLRVHPAGGIEERNRIIGGAGPSVFGIDEEDLPATLDRARGLERVRIRGLHVFAASNERDAERLLETYAAVFALAKRLQSDLGEPLEHIDLGGGLGIPYTSGESELDVELLGAGLAALLDANPWFTGRAILEPGRYLSGPCGTYLVRVIRTKRSRGTDFAILEGGANHLIRPALIGQPFPTKAVAKSGALKPTTLAGPLCTSLDRLGDVELPDLEPGNLLALGACGAYGATEAMTKFLSHPEAREFLHDVEGAGDPLHTTLNP